MLKLKGCIVTNISPINCRLSFRTFGIVAKWYKIVWAGSIVGNLIPESSEQSQLYYIYILIILLWDFNTEQKLFK